MGKKKFLSLKIVFKKNNLPAFCGRLFLVISQMLSAKAYFSLV